ncbi:hypothetical protein CFC21_082774 [Triticum aestivum]|uniref:Uncharacterized protein n=2 Tax=Triticum aestivum TaxID=4565 RepID=A0A9R1I719_WHEAT|nr:hypothetical protein CFC21_082774 [Triticum aestivum]
MYLQLFAPNHRTRWSIKPDTVRLHTNETALEQRRTHRTTQGTAAAAGRVRGQLLTTTEAEHQVKGGLLLDVVVGEGATILQLLASKDQALLVRGNALLVLDLGLDIVDGVRALNLKGDSLSSEGLHEDLHATTQTQDKVEGGLLLDVVVRKGAAILQLLAGKDQALLVRGNALLVLDLGLDIVDGVRALNLQSDGLAGEGLHEDLHATTQTQDKVEGGLLLDVVVSEGSAILQLLASKDETLLVRGNALLVLDLGLDIVDGVRRLHLKGDGLARQCLHKDLHLQRRITDRMVSIKEADRQTHNDRTTNTNAWTSFYGSSIFFHLKILMTIGPCM